MNRLQQHVGVTQMSELEEVQRENMRLRSQLDNPDYIRMNKIFTDEVVQLTKRSNPAMTVLMVLVGKMNANNSLLISNETLTKLTKLSDSSIKRAIRVLRDEKWIDVAKVGTSNVYRVNSDIFWHENSDGKLAEFSTHVVLSFDEQDEMTRQRVAGEMTRHIPMVTTGDYSNANTRPAPVQVQSELGF